MKWFNSTVNNFAVPQSREGINNFLKLSHFLVLGINSPQLKQVPSPQGSYIALLWRKVKYFSFKEHAAHYDTIFIDITCSHN